MSTPDTAFTRPNWLDDGQAVWSLLAIANGECSTLTVAHAQAILADWGDLLGMIGEFAMSAQRAKRALQAMGAAQ